MKTDTKGQVSETAKLMEQVMKSNGIIPHARKYAKQHARGKRTESLVTLKSNTLNKVKRWAKILAQLAEVPGHVAEQALINWCFVRNLNRQ